jgi:integrase
MSTAVVHRSPFETIQALVLNSVNSAHSRRAYEVALRDFFRWYEDMAGGRTISKAMVQEWVAYQRIEQLVIGGLGDQFLHRAESLVDSRRRQFEVVAAAGLGFKGKRDRAVLGLLLGCGLRRSELSALTFDHIQPREGRWVIVDLEGKVRSVPMPSWTKTLIDEWVAVAGFNSGRVIRAMNNRHELASDHLNEGDVQAGAT